MNDEIIKSRHSGENRSPDVVLAKSEPEKYESGFLSPQETLDSGFRRNDRIRRKKK